MAKLTDRQIEFLKEPYIAEFVTLMKDRVPSSLILIGLSLALAALAGGLILQPRSRSKKKGQP